MEAIMKMVDYIFSEEGARLINFGVEGQHYDMVDGKPIIKQEILDGGWTVARGAGMANQTFILPWKAEMFAQMTFKNKAEADMTKLERVAADAFTMYDEYYYNIPPTLETAAYAEYATDLLPMVEELRAKCVTCEITVEEFFTQYEALKPLGLDAINQDAQAAWNLINGL